MPRQERHNPTNATNSQYRMKSIAKLTRKALPRLKDMQLFVQLHEQVQTISSLTTTSCANSLLPFFPHVYLFLA
jgi:hypothetical protein